jgi:uncharacterized protein YpiB (UPF0302 family)
MPLPVFGEYSSFISRAFRIRLISYRSSHTVFFFDSSQLLNTIFIFEITLNMAKMSFPSKISLHFHGFGKNNCNLFQLKSEVESYNKSYISKSIKHRF